MTRRTETGLESTIDVSVRDNCETESKIILPAIVGPDFRPYWDETLSNEEYHADKTAVSSTSLKKILKSPASFLAEYTGEPKKQTEAMRFGSLIHTALLEPEKFEVSSIIMPDFGDQRIKANKEAKAEWLQLNGNYSIILSAEEEKQIRKIYAAVHSHPDASALLRAGKKEISGYFRDPITGLKCKIRPDLWNAEMGILLDVKTTDDCTAEAFSKTIWSYRYDFQMAFYFYGIECITGTAPKYGIFLAPEKETPHEVGVWIADDQVIQKGMSDVRTTLDKLAQCLRENQWPSYQSNLGTISLPRWALSA